VVESMIFHSMEEEGEKNKKPPCPMQEKNGKRA